MIWRPNETGLKLKLQFQVAASRLGVSGAVEGDDGKRKGGLHPERFYPAETSPSIGPKAFIPLSPTQNSNITPLTCLELPSTREPMSSPFSIVLGC